MNGAELLCRSLEAVGVEQLFGLPGTQNVPFFDALRRSRFRTVVPTHELAASFMAAGYSRVSGRVGVLATIPGPGFTYALTGLAEARLDSTPLLYLVGQPAAGPDRRFQLQAIDQAAIAAPLVKCILSADRVGDLPEIIARAHALALEGEPGPVMVHLAPALASQESDRQPELTRPSPPVSPPGVSAALAQELGSASKILILAGQGTAGGATQLEALAERLGAVVVATTSARGVLPEDHPRSLTFDLRSTDTLNTLVQESDLVLALGIKFSHNGAAGFQLRLPPERLVHVDASREVLGANYPARTTVCADVPRLLGDLLPLLPARGAGAGWSVEALERWRRRTREAPLGPEPRFGALDPATPGEFFRVLRAALPRDGCVVTDSGLHQMLARRHFPVLANRGLIVPTNFQSMGFGLPAAIGAKLAAPSRPIVAIVGDGGLAMCGLELLTAVRERLSLPVIVFSDGKYGLIRVDQIKNYGVTYGIDLPPLDAAALAAATGAAYRSLDEDAEGTLRAALDADGPTVIEVSVGDSVGMRRAQAASIARATGRSILPRRLLALLKRLR